MTNNNHHNPQTEVVDRVVEAFDRVPVPPRPDTADTLRALGLEPTEAPAEPKPHAAEDADPVIFSFKRLVSLRKLGTLAAAALIVLALTATLWTPSDFNPSTAFAQAVQKVRAAQTMAFTMSMGMPGHDEPVALHAKIKNPGSMRIDLEAMGIVQVFDFETMQMLVLVPEAKVAQWVNMEGLPKGENPHDMVAEFSRLDPEQTTYLRQERYEGQDAHVYSVDAGPMKGYTWIAADTNLPLRIEFGNPATPDTPSANMVMTGFSWDLELDDALFDQTIPDGYQVREMDLSNATPEDLAKLLRLYAVIAKAPFPAEFGPQTVTQMPQFLIDPSQSQKQNQERVVRILTPVYGVEAFEDGRIQATMEQFSKELGRGALFMAGLAETAEGWHWNAEGKTPGDGSEALCWWKPKGEELYRVIYNDFSVRQVPEAELPTVDE